ncbi:MAG TPA: S8 family serine peptidase [Candidatus Kapabacteria bacterium]|nr:S8 family serine peptidase [Candidatus Kapabacteria bacterium]
MIHNIKILSIYMSILVFSSYCLIALPINKVKSQISGKVLAKNSSIAQDIRQEDILPRMIQVKYKQEVLTKNTNMLVNNILKQVIDIKNINEYNFPFKPKSGEQLLSSEAKFGLDRISTITFNTDIDPVELSIQLMNNDLVEYATPVFRRHFYSTQVNDPYYSQQYALSQIQITDAWDITKGDTSIVIAIVDSGTDFNHEDLQANIFTNWKEIPNNGIDDDNNGKIDDVHGWDFVGNISLSEAQNGIRREDNDPTNFGNTHGTAVAGCASAVTDNAKGIASPGFYSKLLPIKCASDNAQVGSILYAYEGIIYAAKMGADVINCSWGGPGSSPAEQDIINAAVAMGSVVVVAAGNDGTFIDRYPTFPVNYDNVLTVGASAANDAVANFTNYGNSITVFAPGSQVLSTKPNNTYTKNDGTSFSAPIVSGIVALLKSIHPDWTVMQFIRHLRATSDKSLKGVVGNEHYFAGRVNAFRAVSINNPKASENTLPGILAENLAINNIQSYIDKYGQNLLKADLKNYLSNVNNLKVKVSAIDNYIKVLTNELTIDNINSSASKSINIEFELLSNCPWYAGSAQVLLTYESGEYLDYQVLDIPLKLNSDNIFNQVYNLPLSYQITPHGASVPSKGVAWAIGNSPITGNVLYRYNNGNSNLISLSNDPSYAIYAFDGQRALIGVSPNSGATKLQITDNGGASFTQVSVSNITSFVNSIYFYNNNEGIMLGDPISNVWGVAKTQDGGKNWSVVKTVPPPMNGETGFVESMAFLGNNIWFGTSQGRIIYSNDKGSTWNISKTVLGNSMYKIAFMTNKIGYAMYNVGTGNTQKTYLANTIDGGATWTTNVFDFSAAKITPSDIHCVPEAEKLILVDNINATYESDNNGGSWKPILTNRLDAVALAKGINDGISVRMWSFAMTGVAYLDFMLTATKERKEISSVTDNPYDFGEIAVKKTRFRKIEFKNSGNVPLNISKIELIFPNGADTTEFRITSQPSNNTLKPAETASLNVTFKPSSEGKKTVRLLISSDSEPKEYTIILEGTGLKSTDVIDSKVNSFTINPNPAYDNLNIELNSLNISNGNYKIINNLGNTLINSTFSSSNFNIDVHSVGAGNYFLIIESNNKTYVSKFIKM